MINRHQELRSMAIQLMPTVYGASPLRDPDVGWAAVRTLREAKELQFWLDKECEDSGHEWVYYRVSGDIAHGEETRGIVAKCSGCGKEKPQ